MRKCLLFFGLLRDYFALPMELLMYFQNDLIDCIAIEYEMVVCPGYLSSFIRELRAKYSSILCTSHIEPEFLLHGNFIKPEPCVVSEIYVQLKRQNRWADTFSLALKR